MHYSSLSCHMIVTSGNIGQDGVSASAPLCSCFTSQGRQKVTAACGIDAQVTVAMHCALPPLLLQAGHERARDTAKTCAEAVLVPAGASSQQKLPTEEAKAQAAPQQQPQDIHPAMQIQQLQQTEVNTHLCCWIMGISAINRDSYLFDPMHASCTASSCCAKITRDDCSSWLVHHCHCS